MNERHEEWLKQAAYTKEITKEMMEKSKDVLEWVKTQF